MKRAWIELFAERRECPMTYWVHRGPDGESWRDATVTTPPRPGPVPGKGFPVLFVEFDGFTFEFASLAELDVCIETLAQRNLPTAQRLSAERGSGAGPNRHWLSRLPARVTPWKYRQAAVAYLRDARHDFARKLGEP